VPHEARCERALTIGTPKAPNLEIRDLVGSENIAIFYGRKRSTWWCGASRVLDARCGSGERGIFRRHRATERRILARRPELGSNRSGTRWRHLAPLHGERGFRRYLEARGGIDARWWWCRHGRGQHPQRARCVVLVRPHIRELPRNLMERAR